MKIGRFATSTVATLGLLAFALTQPASRPAFANPSPMPILATTLLDGSPATGTIVRAFIGSTLCGSATVAPGFLANTRLSVSASVQAVGCGWNGATVEFTVDGYRADQTVTFSGGTTAMATLRASSATLPRPTPTPAATPSPAAQATPTPSPAATPIAPPGSVLAPMVVSGMARLNGAPAPAGTVVQAYVGSTPCGSATANGTFFNNFRVQVDSASQTGGCATPGAPVTFAVGGISAPTSLTFISGGAAFVSIAVTTDGAATPTPSSVPTPTPLSSTAPTPSPSGASLPMSISGIAFLNGVPAAYGTVVRAYVGTTQCGSGTSNGTSFLNYRLSVAAASSTAGCGTPGAPVTFTVNDSTAPATAAFVSGGSANVMLIVTTTPTPTPMPTGTPTPAPASPTPTPAVTPSPSATPAPGATFRTLEPGSALPSGAECAGRVRRSPWEPRPENAAANRTPGITGVTVDGASATGNTLFSPRIDGNFSGTTDEVIQWGACKWGFDEELVRAVAAQESWWRQSTVGDFADGAYQSFGLLQVKRSVHLGTYPASVSSTAFNIDYALAWRRSCFEGYFSHWIPEAARGDEWGCVGLWFSGNWRDGGALTYISQVQTLVAQRPWLQPGF